MIQQLRYVKLLLFSRPVVVLFSPQIAYGRDFEHSLRYLWADESGPPAQGQGGNWNFLKEVQVNVALPKRHIHNAVLEVTHRAYRRLIVEPGPHTTKR